MPIKTLPRPAAQSARYRDQIVIRQHGGSFQGSARADSLSGKKANFDVYSPIGTANRWALHNFRAHYNADALVGLCFVPYAVYDCNVVQGRDYAVLADFTMPDGSWGRYSPSDLGSSAYVMHSINLALSYRLQLTLPAGATKVFVLGLCDAGGGIGGITCTAGTVTMPRLNFKTAAQDGVDPAFGTVAPMHDARSTWHDRWVKVAAGELGGATLTITPEGAANRGRLYIAAIRVITGGAAGPEGGVYDPDTLALVQPSGNYDTLAPSFQFGAAGTPFFYGFGHFGATNILTSPAETMVLDDGDLARAFSVTADADQAIVCRSFRQRITGDGQMDNAGAQDCIDFSQDIRITSDGFRATATYTVNDNGATQDLRLTATNATTGVGGFAGLWNLFADRFTAVGLAADMSLATYALVNNAHYPTATAWTGGGRLIAADSPTAPTIIASLGASGVTMGGAYWKYMTAAAPDRNGIKGYGYQGNAQVDLASGQVVCLSCERRLHEPSELGYPRQA
jgi:hypothetical protein